MVDQSELTAAVAKHARLAQAAAVATLDRTTPTVLELRFADTHAAGAFADALLSLRPAPAPAPIIPRALPSVPAADGSAMPYATFAQEAGAPPRKFWHARYANGITRPLSDDEAAVARHVEALELQLAGDAFAVVPELPYTVRHQRYGFAGVAGPLRAVKVRTGVPVGADELLTPDEAAAWARLQTLQARAQAANVTEPANRPLPRPAPHAAPESNGRDLVAKEAALEMPTSGAEPEVAPGSSLRDRVRAALLADPGASNGAIAQEFACSDEYVRLRRKELEALGQLAPVPVRRADGTTYQRATVGTE